MPGNERKTPHHVEVRVVRIIKNGWVHATITKVHKISEDLTCQMPCVNEFVAIPSKIGNQNGAAIASSRLFCKIVPNQKQTGQSKWFAVYCSKEDEPNKKDVPKKTWNEHQVGSDSIILQIPSTKPGSAHNGLSNASKDDKNELQVRNLPNTSKEGETPEEPPLATEVSPQNGTKDNETLEEEKETNIPTQNDIIPAKKSKSNAGTNDNKTGTNPCGGSTVADKKRALEDYSIEEIAAYVKNRPDIKTQFLASLEEKPLKKPKTNEDNDDSTTNPFELFTESKQANDTVRKILQKNTKKLQEDTYIKGLAVILASRRSGAVLLPTEFEDFKNAEESERCESSKVFSLTVRGGFYEEFLNTVRTVVSEGKGNPLLHDLELKLEPFKVSIGEMENLKDGSVQFTLEDQSPEQQARNLLFESALCHFLLDIVGLQCGEFAIRIQSTMKEMLDQAEASQIKCWYTSNGKPLDWTTYFKERYDDDQFMEYRGILISLAKAIKAGNIPVRNTFIAEYFRKEMGTEVEEIYISDSCIVINLATPWVHD
jgi:hypothetical protein